jgi:hypothetical protein
MNPNMMLQMAMQKLRQNGTPQANNFLEMIKNNDISGIEQFGRNMAQSRGVDFDAEFEKFKSQFRF